MPEQNMEMESSGKEEKKSATQTLDFDHGGGNGRQEFGKMMTGRKVTRI